MFLYGNESSEMSDKKTNFKSPGSANALSGSVAALKAQLLQNDEISRTLRSVLNTQKQIGQISDLTKNLPKAELQDTISAAMRHSKTIQAAFDSIPRKAVQDLMQNAPRALRSIEQLPHAQEPSATQPSQAQIRDVSDLGAAVRNARKAKGLTQQNFADLAGVGRRFLSELEQGKQTLEIGKVLKVAAAVGIQLLMATSETDE